MKLGVLIDPLDGLHAYKDTSIAILASAQARGWSCYYFTPLDMFSRAAEAYARVYSISIQDVTQANWAITHDLGEWPLSDFDIILMRKDPPFDLSYIYHTYVLELAAKKGVLVANHPQSLRDANEKFFTLNFPACCPPTLVTANIDHLQAFWQQHQQIILKPLDGMGGHNIFYIDKQAHNLTVILTYLTQNQTTPIMAQRYIPAILTQGDKRILMINGEPIDYALARLPKSGEMRGNLAAGGQGTVVPLTPRDRYICEQIGPTLKQKKLYFVGIDVIGDYLTEINVTSPTCLVEIAAETGIDISGKYLDVLASLKASAVSEV